MGKALCFENYRSVTLFDRRLSRLTWHHLFNRTTYCSYCAVTAVTALQPLRRYKTKQIQNTFPELTQIRQGENLKSALLLRVSWMPITDATKKQIAQQRRLFFKICFKCGAKNPISADRCRKCHSSALRLKNRTLGAKK